MAVRETPLPAPAPPVTLVRICDLAGRPRGTGFVADDLGTVVTSHEAVDGLSRVVLHAPGERTCLAETEAIVPLPETGLALVRTEGLGVRPVPVAAREEIETGLYVRLAAGGWREARVLRQVPVTYTATDRFHLIDGAVELAMGTAGSDALRLGGPAAGGPVLDAGTGAVLAVLGTALCAERRAAGFAVPLWAAAATRPDGPLAELLRRNAATVPAYGPDLNLAGAMRLTAAAPGGPAPVRGPHPVERPRLQKEFTAFSASADALVLALAGGPGTGRTTELAALAERRARGPACAPTLRLHGAGLRAGDTSVADAVGRALREAERAVAASGEGGPGAGAASPERVARVAQAAGRPLFVLLDDPEDMPPGLLHRLPDWTAGTVSWLRGTGARLVVACRAEYWQTAGPLFPAGAAHRPARPFPGLPGAVRIGNLSEAGAAAARDRYGIPDGTLADPADARHPLTLRLLAQVREALPGGMPGHPSREDVYAAYLDLVCLRVAVRLAAACRPAPPGSGVRRLAAKVAGQMHEAARRCLGPEGGALDRASFEEIFPPRTGWASAVLTEGLLVPAGDGYRFAHAALADWLQGQHLDIDAALIPLRDATAEPARAPASARPLLLERHRVGPVVESLLLLHRVHGPPALARRLMDLVHALEEPAAAGGPPPDSSAPAVPAPRGPEAPGGPAGGTPAGAEDGYGVQGGRSWWACRLLAEVLSRLGDATGCLGVLRVLADAITRWSARGDAPHWLDRAGEPGTPGEFGPAFWERLRVPEEHRLDLLRRLVPADGPPGRVSGTVLPQGRYLDAVARRLEAVPRSVQPLLCQWFDDERRLPAADDADVRPTVADTAQALLYARRALAVDDLTEALADSGHPRAGELLTALAEEEPSALCRAVDRWSHDDTRPGRPAAAAAHGLATAPYVTTRADRELLRYAALALLTRPGDTSLHGPALGLLVRDPETRPRYLPRALAAFARDGAQLPAGALAAALPTDPAPVLAAFLARLADGGDGAAEVLRALADVRTPALAPRAAELVRAYIARHPDGAVHAAAYVDRCLEHGPEARAALRPLVTGLLRDHPRQVRRALGPVLAAPGTSASRALRGELLDVLLDCEQRYGRHGQDAECGVQDVGVLEAVLLAAGTGARSRDEARTRDLVHRTGMLLARTPQGAACFDRLLLGLAREVPGFGALVAGWLAAAPHEWAAVVGPGARRALGSLASAMPMRAAPRGHGSLRPA
ncbi:serine protease [Streptomyces albidochromogenes]|uniref:Serine protease n=1 Tax=Streptomyces albidochromogenes TaxID=329524 RepID=A0ABW6FDL0_9ACTN